MYLYVSNKGDLLCFFLIFCCLCSIAMLGVVLKFQVIMKKVGLMVMWPEGLH